MNFNSFLWGIHRYARHYVKSVLCNGYIFRREIIMRFFLSVFIVSFLLVHVSGKSLAQRVNLERKNSGLKEILIELRKQTGYDFVCTDQLFSQSRKVNIRLKDAGIEESLKQIFRDQPLDYSIQENTVVVKEKEKTILEKIRKVLSLPVNIKGKVTDENGEPLAGATVKIRGSSKAIYAGSEGEFAFTDIPEGSILVISFIGYGSQEVPVKNDGNDLIVRLQKEANVLKDAAVVSTGYQQLPKERATGSFVQVDNALLNKRISSNLIDRLEGNVPGLLFNKNTSKSINGNNDINIRGHSTLFANDQPLIVVDNFPFDGPISNINPNDVATVTVLKDAAASSIWGVRAGNGVIVITTKKGAVNEKLKIEVNTNVTIGGKPDLYYAPLQSLSSSDYINTEITLFNMGYYTTKLDNSTRPAVTPVVSILDKIKKNELDSISGYRQIDAMRNNDVRSDLEKYFYQQSINQQYAVNLQGGGNKSDFFFSAGYDKNRSNQVGNDNNRINLSSQYNFYPIKKLSLSAGINFTQTKATTNSVANDLSALYPFPVYSDLTDDETGEALRIAKRNPAYIDTVGGGRLLDWSYRPYDELRYSDNHQSQYHNKINLGAKYVIIDGLSASAKYQYEKGNTTGTNLYSLDTYYTRDLINRFTQLNSANPYPVPMGSIMNENRSELTAHRGRAQLDYSKSWKGIHEVVGILGAEINETVTNSSAKTAFGYNKETLTTVNVNLDTSYPNMPSGSSRIPNSNGFGKYTDRYISYFGNASYSYVNRYIFSLSGRIDKSNLFGVNTNQKAVPLYSAGLAWNFSKEDFYHLNWLPYGKLRATYGYSGNVDKSATAITTFSVTNGSWFYGTPYARIINPGNPELRWEKIRMINLGLDFGLKNNVLSGSLEYYMKNGIDLFGYSPLPGSTGLSTFYGNTANVRTRGFDINLNSININTANLRWTSAMQISSVKDIVTKYNTKFSPANLLVGLRPEIIQPIEGNSLFGIYSYRWAGLTYDTGDPQGFLNGQPSTDYSAIITATTLDSLVYNGPARPTIFGSLRNSLSYKKISLSFNITFKLNYFFRRNTIDYSALYSAGIGHSDYYKRWVQPGDEMHTNIPSIVYPPLNDRQTFYTQSETFVEKGDHIRLQDVSLQYDINTNFKNISGIQVYCYTNNVGILWRANQNKIDPDVYASGYPVPRSFSLGLKAKF